MKNRPWYVGHIRYPRTHFQKFQIIIAALQRDSCFSYLSTSKLTGTAEGRISTNSADGPKVYVYSPSAKNELITW